MALRPYGINLLHGLNHTIISKIARRKRANLRERSYSLLSSTDNYISFGHKVRCPGGGGGC